MADPTLAGSGEEAGTKLAGHMLLFEPSAIIHVTGPETAGTCLAPSEERVFALSNPFMPVTRSLCFSQLPHRGLCWT